MAERPADLNQVSEMLKREYGLIAPSGRDPDGDPYSVADTVKAIIDGERAERDKLRETMTKIAVYCNALLTQRIVDMDEATKVAATKIREQAEAALAPNTDGEGGTDGC